MLELFTIDILSGNARQLTQVNTAYEKLNLPTVLKKWIKTSDGKQMLSWVIYPLILTQLKISKLIVLPRRPTMHKPILFISLELSINGFQRIHRSSTNRQCMPGWGSAWNEQISGDWGGQCMKDYLAAIDQVSEAYIDKKSSDCGWGQVLEAILYLCLLEFIKTALKPFISHCGTYNLESWYSSTEELWFCKL